MVAMPFIALVLAVAVSFQGQANAKAWPAPEHWLSADDSPAVPDVVFDAIFGVEKSKHCSVKCNDDTKLGQELAIKKPYMCWGEFTVFCKGHTNDTCYGGGIKCEGKFTGLALNSSKVAVCEGLFHSIGKAVKLTKSHKVVKKFSATGCLGTHAAAVVKPADSDSEIDAVALGSQMHSIWMDTKMDDASAHLSAEMFGHADSIEYAAEARCNGRGGAFKGVAFPAPKGAAKQGSARSLLSDLPAATYQQHSIVWPQQSLDGEADEAMLGSDETFLQVQASLNQTLDDLNMELLPTSLLPNSGWESFPPDFGPHHGHKCHLSCNGKPAWLHGALPCFGKFSVACTFEKPADEDSSPPAVTYLCKGFWSGWFGKVCAGFASEHFEGGPVEAWSFFTGKQGFVIKKSPHAAGFGKWFKGKALAGIKVESCSD